MKIQTSFKDYFDILSLQICSLMMLIQRGIRRFDQQCKAFPDFKLWNELIIADNSANAIRNVEFIHPLNVA